MIIFPLQPALLSICRLMEKLPNYGVWVQSRGGLETFMNHIRRTSGENTVLNADDGAPRRSSALPP